MPYPTSSSSTALGNIFQSSDGTFTETFVIPASAPYTHMIGAAAPYNYPAGWQIIPPSGVSNAVTITGAAHAAWTSVASNPTAGQYVYDTSISPTGGTLTFAAADASQTVTATWIGSTDVNKALMQALVTALKDIGAAGGAPSGLATLDSGSHLIAGQLPTTITVASKLTLPTNNYSNVAGGGGVVAVGAALSGNVPVNSGIANGTTWQVNTTAATAGSTPVVTPACGAVSNIGFAVQTNPGGGSFIVMLNTTNGAVLSAAGGFYWAIVSSL